MDFHLLVNQLFMFIVSKIKFYRFFIVKSEKFTSDKSLCRYSAKAKHSVRVIALMGVAVVREYCKHTKGLWESMEKVLWHNFKESSQTSIVLFFVTVTLGIA